MGGSWYLASLAEHDAHRGTPARGRVHAVCGIAFAPLRAGRTPAHQRVELEPAQLCPECVRAPR